MSVVRSAIKNDIDIERKKVAKSRYNEPGDPCSSVTNSSSVNSYKSNESTLARLIFGSVCC